LTFSSTIAVLALIVGAVYMTSAVANPEQAEKGKKIILAAALGLVVTISAFALVNTVLSGGEATPAISISL
jgi:glycerol uptake facilitator-like aquaporin